MSSIKKHSFKFNILDFDTGEVFKEHIITSNLHFHEDYVLLYQYFKEYLVFCKKHPGVRCDFLVTRYGDVPELKLPF